MPDMKDQMIEEQQDRRERMHQAANDVEGVMHAQNGTCGRGPFHGDAYIYRPAEYCDKFLDKHCLISGHFGWFLEHEATSVDSDGTYGIRHISKAPNDNGSAEITTEITKEPKCRHPDAKEDGGCNVVKSARIISTALRSYILIKIRLSRR